MPPYILFGLVLAAIYGTIFYIWQGQQLIDLVLYLLVALVGLAVGQLLGLTFAFDFVMIGPLYIVEGTVISWLSLFAARWLKITTENQPPI
ncbi:hypothetical protein QUF58_01910 [Anaerolineales bacterium HSG24]|nr:hypothetical protein [Anaerolineales bacterium HSG24]